MNLFIYVLLVIMACYIIVSYIIDFRRRRRRQFTLKSLKSGDENIFIINYVKVKIINVVYRVACTEYNRD